MVDFSLKPVCEESTSQSFLIPDDWWQLEATETVYGDGVTCTTAAAASWYTAHQIPAFSYCVCHFFISYVLSQVKSKDVQVRGNGYLTRQYKSGSHACASQPWPLLTLWTLLTLAWLQSLFSLISCAAVYLGPLGRKHMINPQVPWETPLKLMEVSNYICEFHIHTFNQLQRKNVSESGELDQRVKVLTSKPGYLNSTPLPPSPIPSYPLL